MAPIVMKFGGYQEPASIHNRAAARFGELLKEKLGDRAGFELMFVVKDRKSVCDAFMGGLGDLIGRRMREATACQHRTELDPKLFAYLG